jgi:hypothetical protein
MSLKNRLRISILLLVISVVLALTALNLQSSVQETFADSDERARLLADEVQIFAIERIRETKGLIPADAVLRGDAPLARILERIPRSTSFVTQILVADDQNRVLAASDPKQVGEVLPGRPSLAGSRQQQTWARLGKVLTSGGDHVVASSIKIEDPQLPQLSTMAVVSSSLLRAEMMPQLRQLAVVALVSILLSGILAIVISNLVGGSLERISRNIERISKGDQKEHDEKFESEELANLQLKLTLLGKQYHGAREDVLALRTNISQMIQRLEEAVLVFGSDQSLQLAGPPADRLLARNHRDLIGRQMKDVFPSWTQLGAAIQAAVKLLTPMYDYPVTYARSNMPDAKLLVSVETVNNPAEEHLGTLVTLRDAEMRRQLENQLDISNRVAAIHRLTSGVAHEIKNPLNAITLHLEVAKSKMGAPREELEKELEFVSREVLRLDRVVRTFLNFSRPLELKMDECDLTDLAREVALIAGQQTGRDAIRVSLSCDIEKPIIIADRDLSKQAILNVVINAIEAMRDSGEVQMTIEKSFEDYVVSVTDSGPGMPPEIHEKIYNLYFTTKPNADGIGLAVTYMAMQLHNGSVDFDSQVGKGTSFRLRFPAARKATA